MFLRQNDLYRLTLNGSFNLMCPFRCHEKPSTQSPLTFLHIWSAFLQKTTTPYSFGALGVCIGRVTRRRSGFPHSSIVCYISLKPTSRFKLSFIPRFQVLRAQKVNLYVRTVKNLLRTAIKATVSNQHIVPFHFKHCYSVFQCSTSCRFR